MVDWTDLTGVDERLARRILVVARSIAPGLGSLTGEARFNAIAVLQGIVEDAVRTPRGVQSQRIGPASVTYQAIRSWFSEDDRAALRSLVAGVSAAGLPLGSFPPPSRVVSRMWPEDRL